MAIQQAQGKRQVTGRDVLRVVLCAPLAAVCGHALSWGLDVHVGFHLWLFLQRWYIQHWVTDLLHQQRQVNDLVWSLGITSELPALLLVLGAVLLAARHRTPRYVFVILIAFALGSAQADVTHYLDLVHSVTGIPLPWLHDASNLIIGA